MTAQFIDRTYSTALRNHFADGPEMALLAGPRQVGKTTLARLFNEKIIYLNWDNEEHRQLILAGPSQVAEHIGLQKMPVVIFDEIHKFPHWKNFIKGFFDTYGGDKKMRIIVTGSARLDIYRKGGDSLMGRYFLYRMHPLSVAELLTTINRQEEIVSPAELADKKWQRLLEFGGFPQPFLRGDRRFYKRWKRTRLAQIFQEDIHDIARVHEIRLVELLADLLSFQAGQLTSYATLSRKLRVAENSVRRWLNILESLYFCFPVRPWHHNIARALRKEPKYYLWDYFCGIHNVVLVELVSIPL